MFDLHQEQTFRFQRYWLTNNGTSTMISYEDCAAMCGLDLDEIAAIAEHEHVPELAAAALGNYLLHKSGGETEIRRMLVDDIRTAIAEERLDHATELLMALRHFMTEHPGVATCSSNNVDQSAA